MNFEYKYKKYKQKYITQKGGNKKQIQFILFGDVMTGHDVWFYDMEKNKTDFVKLLKKTGDVIILKPNYVNFMKYTKFKTGQNAFYKTKINNINFTVEDLYFENYSLWVKTKIDLNKKFIAISLDQGCHFAKYFCNQEKNNCVAL